MIKDTINDLEYEYYFKALEGTLPGTGGIPTPDPGILADNEMLKANAGGTEIIGTGDTNSDTEVDFGSKDVKCKTVITESSSVDVGPGVTLSDRGGALQNRSNVTGRDFISIDSLVDDSGSQKPLYDSREAKVVRSVAQPVDTTTMSNVSSYAVTPTVNQDIHRVYVKLVNPITNFRAEVVSDVTGMVVKYIPSRNDWDNNTGLDFTAGEVFFDLNSPLAEYVGYPLTVNVVADQAIDVLGDGTNPWRAVDSQDIISLVMADESDLAPEMTASNVISLDGLPTQASTTTVDVPAGSWRHVTFDAQGVKTEVVIDWAEQLGLTVPNLGTAVAQKLVVDTNGDVVFIDEVPTDATNRDYANLAVVSHPTGVITSVVPNVYKGQEVYSQLVDTLDTMGVTRKSGLAVNLNTDLSFDRTAGILQGAGAGVAAGSRGQNLAKFNAEAPATFSRILGITNTIENATATAIDPGFWDDGSGTKAAISAPTQQATIISIYQAIAGTTGLGVLYGQTLYPTLDDAVLNAPTDIPDLPDVLQANANLIERIAVRSDATNLLDPLQAQALGGVKFGTGLGGAGFGNVSGGGDMFGAPSSAENEAVTFADNGGHTAKSGSNLTMTDGTVKRILGTGNTELQSGNGISKVQVTPTLVNIVAKNASDNSTTTWTLNDSNGSQFGGSSLNVNSTSGSAGYRSSQNGALKNQMYWNAAEDLTHVSHKGTTSVPASDIVLDDDNIATEFAGVEVMKIDDTGRFEAGKNVFPAGDDFLYPSDDGSSGDQLVTNGTGNLTLQPDNFQLVSASGTIEADNKRLYIDSTAGDMTLTLADNPRVGERKLIWMGDNTNTVELVSANPTYPIDPASPPAEANVQGMWTLSSDFADRYETDRDLTNNGTGGTFDPVSVNGNAVNAFNFQQSSYLEASASAYKGIAGGAARSFTCWYGANAGTPVSDENLVSWGEDIAPGGLLWEVEFRGSQGYLWVNNRNAWRRWPFASLEAVNLFDGNMHHIAVTQSSANMNSILLYVDGVQVVHSSQDQFPACNTTQVTNFRLGGSVFDGSNLNGKMYDARLFDRALTQNEVLEVRDENILGGVTISALYNDMLMDVVYNGSSWVLGTGTEALLSDVDGRLTAIEDVAMLGTGVGSTAANQVVTFADADGSQTSNASNMTMLSGDIKSTVFNEIVSLADQTGDVSLTLNPVTGNVDITDGAGGVFNFFNGRLRVSNTSDTPNLALGNETGGTVGGFLYDEPNNHTLFYRGDGVTNFNEMKMYPVRTTFSRGFSIDTTSEAFIMPRVTTAQMNIIQPDDGSMVYNTDLNLVVFGNGTAWTALSTLVSVSGKTLKQDVVGLAGTFQDIQSGTFNYYNIDDRAATPNFTNGAWVVPATGIYNFNVRGRLVNNTGSENQIHMYVGVDGGDYNTHPDKGIDGIQKDGTDVALSGQVSLTAGETVRIGYSILSGTGWEILGFNWDVSRVGS